ncbi:hypothetical protein QR680_000644 [Steinernema hermaphroditum]|uniref:Chitin-binding type-2 domain-containing protein n=1 Tax=Steinernema hermaphroditum TaxID=289476 RepID=A0AA39GVC3_9BILA|nr:hypothetical protein QR680_000644 [Steinernema hermaphroditum]
MTKFLLLAAFLPLFFAEQTTTVPGDDELHPDLVVETYSQQLHDADCVTYGEGAFVFGCTDEYFVCESTYIGFRKYMFHCPIGHDGQRLKMNPLNDQCDHQANIEVCKEQTETSSYDSAIKIIRKEPFSCKNRNDGYHEIESCSEQYAYCYTGYLYFLLCPSADLFYDSTTGTCDYKINCEGQEQKESDGNGRFKRFAQLR